MNHILPKLNYSHGALEPHISERTIDFHYGKHHNAYVSNLNRLIEGTDYESSSLEDIIMKAEGGIFNNAAQVWNHSFYFNGLSPAGGGKPAGELKKALERDFQSFEQFKENFTKAAVSLFGSGWVWLVKEKGGRLSIVQTSNAGNPMREGLVPVLTCDVWEHAYYLDYQNRRPDHLLAFWEIVDWDVVSERLGS